MNFNNLEIILNFKGHLQYSISLPTYRFIQYFVVLKIMNLNLS